MVGKSFVAIRGAVSHVSTKIFHSIDGVPEMNDVADVFEFEEVFVFLYRFPQINHVLAPLLEVKSPLIRGTFFLGVLNEEHPKHVAVLSEDG